MKWIAHFLLLFFTLGCDNPESEEDVELLKQQDKILNLELRSLTGGIPFSHRKKFTKKLHLFFKSDTNFTYSKKTIQTIKDTFNFDVKNRLEFQLASYNYINTNLAHLKKTPKNNFFIQLNDSVFTQNDTLKISLFWEQEKSTEDSIYTPFETPDELIQFATKKNLDYYYQFQLMRSYDCNDPISRQKELLYPIFYNILGDSTIKLKEKHSTLSNLFQATSNHSFYPLTRDTSFKKYTHKSYINKEMLNIMAYKYYHVFRGNIGIWERWRFDCISTQKPPYENIENNFVDTLYNVSPNEFFVLEESNNYNCHFDKTKHNHCSKEYSITIKRFLRYYKLKDFIQFDITLNDEYGKPKHYKTNKVPFKIIGYE